MRHYGLLKLSTILSSLLFSTTLLAEPAYSTRASLYGYTQSIYFDESVSSSIYGTPITTVGDYTSNGDTSFSSLVNFGHQITGVNENNEEATMTLSYEARSQVSAGGVLKAYTSASIDNHFYYPEGNDPFVIDANFNTDPNGVPESFSVKSAASYFDHISLTGSNELSSIKVNFQLDGTLTGTSDAYVTQRNGSSVTYLEYLTGSNSTAVDTVIESNLITVDNNEALLSFTLESESNLYHWHPSDQATSDFYNTLSISGISGFDVNGNPVDLASATDSTGFSFNTTRIASTVPEPSTYAMMALGLLCIAGMSRRKNQA